MIETPQTPSHNVWAEHREEHSTIYRKSKPHPMFQISVCSEPLSPKHKKGHAELFSICYDESLDSAVVLKSLSLGPGTMEYFAEAEKITPGYRPMRPKELERFYQAFVGELGDFPDEQLGATLRQDLDEYHSKALKTLKE